MAINLSKQFNSASVGFISLVGSGGESTNVAVQLEMSQLKSLTGVFASVTPTTGVGAVVPVLFSRLIVVTGGVTFEPNTNNVVGGPVVARAINYPTGVNRVLLDLDFSDKIDLDFSDYIEVESEEILTAIIGPSIVYQNGTVSLGEIATTRLTLKGFQGESKKQGFPYRMR